MLPESAIHRRRAAAARLARTAVPVALLLTGCAEAESGGLAPIEVEDAAGRTVRLDAPAGRVVSVIPSATEWILAIGAGDRLVARTDFDRHPALDTLPSVGGGLTPSIEWLAARRPDLVVAWPDAPSRSAVSRLESLGIPVYTAAAETRRDAFRTAAALGRLLGLGEDADAAIAEVHRGLDSVRTSVAEYPPMDVLYLVGLEPLTAAGPGTFVAELIGTAGGRNVLDGLDVRWPQLALEDVVARAPEVVIVAAADAGEPLEGLAERPGWRDVPAVVNGRVHAVDPDSVNRWGPGMDEGAALLARLIHPPETRQP